MGMMVVVRVMIVRVIFVVEIVIDYHYFSDRLSLFSLQITD